jgi:hypothetical protein
MNIVYMNLCTDVNTHNNNDKETVAFFCLKEGGLEQVMYCCRHSSKQFWYSKALISDISVSSFLKYSFIQHLSTNVFCLLFIFNFFMHLLHFSESVLATSLSLSLTDQSSSSSTHAVSFFFFLFRTALYQPQTRYK